MCSQACIESPDGIGSHKSLLAKKGSLAILPCTVSQLLTAAQVSQDSFTICDWELHQVSVLGVVREFSPLVTNVQYSVDDMTGPPLNVKQWVNAQDCARMTLPSPGTYVKVTGSLRKSMGQRSLLAVDIRCFQDLNEITSHMLEVVRAHMLWFGKMFDVNMNTTAASLTGRALGHAEVCPEGILPCDLSTIQSQVLHVIRTFSVREPIGVSFQELKTQLDYISIIDISFFFALITAFENKENTLTKCPNFWNCHERTSLTFLMNKGHIFHTVDEHHFKSVEY